MFRDEKAILDKIVSGWRKVAMIPLSSSTASKSPYCMLRCPWVDEQTKDSENRRILYNYLGSLCFTKLIAEDRKYI